MGAFFDILGSIGEVPEYALPLLTLWHPRKRLEAAILRCEMDSDGDKSYFLQTADKSFNWISRTSMWAYTPEVPGHDLRMERAGKCATNKTEAPSDGTDKASASSDNACAHTMYKCMILAADRRNKEEKFKTDARSLLL